jgi:hypothetical protein
MFPAIVMIFWHPPDCLPGGISDPLVKNAGDPGATKSDLACN